ncbi:MULTISPECIES: hypothetical protein [Brevundimonas]|uniref:hypothetical protein n=1 Tax=Brevundimonas TaxID=41275 RepID=UPI000F03C627|nr:hypothetical protein [Brevundimonas lutea]
MTSLDTPVSNARQRTLRRRTILARSALVVILGPALIYFLYLLLLAPPQYTATAAYAVRGAQSGGGDALSAIGLVGATSTSTDARIVDDFIRSPAMVEKLRARFGFNEAYSRPTLDPFSYLPRNAPLERATNFWRDKVEMSFDPATSATTVQIAAYRAEDALRLTNGVLMLGEELVNTMSDRAMSDLSAAARQEIERKRTEYETARDRLAALQGTRSSVDVNTPQEQAAGLVGALDSQLAAKRTELASATQIYQPSAPQIRQLRQEIAALEGERARAVSAAMSSPGEGAAAGQIEAQAVLMDYEFAQTAYQSALAAGEAARRQDMTDRKYVIAYVPPELPQTNDRWSRLSNVLALLIASALIWSIGALTYSIIRDHME